jgi:hypothetical protein
MRDSPEREQVAEKIEKIQLQISISHSVMTLRPVFLHSNRSDPNSGNVSQHAQGSYGVRSSYVRRLHDACHPRDGCATYTLNGGVPMVFPGYGNAGTHRIPLRYGDTARCRASAQLSRSWSLPSSVII